MFSQWLAVVLLGMLLLENYNMQTRLLSKNRHSKARSWKFSVNFRTQCSKKQVHSEPKNEKVTVLSSINLFWISQKKQDRLNLKNKRKFMPGKPKSSAGKK